MEERVDRVSRLIWGFALVAGVLGIVFRLDGLGNSLWVDEFGTLWCVEGSLSVMIDRVFEAQGQTPFYYFWPWVAVQLAGESEAVLRLPSVIFGLTTLWVVYLLGREVADREVGLVAAGLLSLSYVAVDANASARPYGLVLLSVAVMLLGFVRAVLTGRTSGRVLFVLGCSGIFAASYVMVLLPVSVGVAYLVLRNLRRNYPMSRFATDTGIALLSVSPWIPHLWALWHGQEGMLWMGAPDYWFLFELLGPWLLLALVGSGSALVGNQPDLDKTLIGALWLAVFGPIGVLILLATVGPNLLHSRYAIGVLIPAAVLAATGWRARWSTMLVPLLLWGSLTAMFFYARYLGTGTFSRSIVQDWRQAAVRLSALLEPTPKAPVLYRSCFVQHDLVPQGYSPSLLLANLRSPGKQRPDWNVIPLTYRWSHTDRAQYFDQVVEPALRDEPIFYLLSCAFHDDFTGNYAEEVKKWVEAKFPGEYEVSSDEAGYRILLLRFENEPGSAVENSEPLTTQ